MTAYLVLIVVFLIFALLFCALFRRSYVKIAMETLGTKLVFEATDVQIVPRQSIEAVDPKKRKDRSSCKAKKRNRALDLLPG